MNVQYLIQVLSNKLVVLNNAKVLAFNAGDFAQINTVEEEILGVENTLSQLRLLQTLDSVAVTADTTPAEVVTTAVQTLQNPVQGPSAGAVINGYDLSAYATDALYEVKIKNILASMPAFATTYDVDLYIMNLAPTSPLLGSMILEAVTRYPVDIPLLLAIMQNDSLFGTLGVGARTNNPGNVGNTGTETRAYPSWQDGVIAVAEWLSRHHAVVIAIDNIKSNLVVSGAPTSTPAFVMPTSTPATVTPISPPVVVMPTSTPATVTPVSTPIIDFATSTPPVVATSTPPIALPIISPPAFVTSTPVSEASSTPPVINPEPAPATSTLERIIQNIVSPTSTDQNIVTSTAEIATSTPAVETATSTP